MPKVHRAGLPPALVLIAGGLLLPLLKGGARTAALLVLPLMTLWLVWQVPEGVALGLGELTTLSVGTVTMFRGARPGLRVSAGTGPLILVFDDVASRDRVAAELIAESGLDLIIPPAVAADARAASIGTDA